MGQELNSKIGQFFQRISGSVSFIRGTIGKFALVIKQSCFLVTLFGFRLSIVMEWFIPWSLWGFFLLFFSCVVFSWSLILFSYELLTTNKSEECKVIAFYCPTSTHNSTAILHTIQLHLYYNTIQFITIQLYIHTYTYS